VKWLPKSLFGQILLALFAGLLAAQAVGVWLILDERTRFADRLLGTYAAQRIAGIASLLDAADERERARLVLALSVPPTRISLDEPWRRPEQPPSAEALMFSGLLERELTRPHELQVLSILLAHPGRPRAGRAGLRPLADKSDEPAQSVGSEMRRKLERESRQRPGKRLGRRPLLLVVAQIKLADGAIATFRHALPQAPTDRPLRLMALVAITGITVALLAGWSVRRLTRPLTTLADAATGLARNLDRPPLAESGPTEVMLAARAFNTMQRELKANLETRSQALAGVSHDLRLPITRAKLRLEQLSDAQVKRSIEADLDEMEQMIANTLEFLRAGSSAEAFVRLNLNALIEGVAEDMEALGANVQVRGRAGAPLNARPQSLRRCLANLLDNARRHGGSAIEITLLDSLQCVEIRIEDRGPGIPAAECARVFEPYVRLEPSRAKHTGGTGLGLAIARAIARAHGGDVTLENRDGGGLCVLLTLPRTADV
jgi:signal transduction histidine kinase